MAIVEGETYYNAAQVDRCVLVRKLKILITAMISLNELITDVHISLGRK